MPIRRAQLFLFVLLFLPLTATRCHGQGGEPARPDAAGLRAQAPAQASSPVQAEPVTAEPDWPDAPLPAQPQEAAQSSTAQAQAPEQSKQQIAEEQLKQQKKQRVLGVFPMFNTSYLYNAETLTAGQKMRLAFRSAVDPVSFAGGAVIAGLSELGGPDNNNGFGWGADGYFKRWGAAYLDSFDGTMIGNGILPSLLRQDPRYFRLGRGSTTRRTFYSLANAVICRHDHSRKWEPNYSNVGGNIAAGAIATLYYPSTPERSGWGQTITSAMIVTAQGAVGGLFQEFWPDISRKFLHKDPTNGMDAQQKEADKKNPEEKGATQPLPPAPK